MGRSDLPVIYMSGYTADTDMVAALRDQPGTRFLEKPFRNSDLLARIAEALGGRTTVSGPYPRI
jgi:FixJ family two-component response regulator